MRAAAACFGLVMAASSGDLHAVGAEGGVFGVAPVVGAAGDVPGVGGVEATGGDVADADDASAVGVADADRLPRVDGREQADQQPVVGADRGGDHVLAAGAGGGEDPADTGGGSHLGGPLVSTLFRTMLT